jgi:hypothetical protein
MKYDGVAYRNKLAECMCYLGWVHFMADRNVWVKAGMQPGDGVAYYAYVLIYVYGILCVHHDPGASLEDIAKYFIPCWMCGESHEDWRHI